MRNPESQVIIDGRENSFDISVQQFYFVMLFSAPLEKGCGSRGRFGKIAAITVMILMCLIAAFFLMISNFNYKSSNTTVIVTVMERPIKRKL